jgi:hypothetical protein
MVTQRHGYASSETRQEQAAREAREDEMKREYAGLAGSGSVLELEAGQEKLNAEKAALLAELPALSALANVNQHQHGPAHDLALSRLRRVRLLAGEIDRALRSARQERAERLSRDFAKDKSVQQLYLDAARSWSEQLETTALLASAFNGAVRAGAGAQQMPPQPTPRVNELHQLVAWVRQLQRQGVDVRDGLTPAVRAHL